MTDSDKEFENTLQSTATRLAGAEAAALVTPDWMSLLMELITGFISSCFGNNSPTPNPTPSSVASQLKSMSGLQKSVLRNRAKRHYVKNGMTKQHGKLAAETLITTSEETPEDKLTAAVAHVQGVNESFPDLEMF